MDVLLKNIQQYHYKIHEPALRIKLDNNIDSLVELLARSQDITNHHQDTQILMTKLYIFVNNLSPWTAYEHFYIWANYGQPFNY